MFSGSTVSSSTYTTNLYAYDIAADVWTQLKSGNGPGRTYHQAVADKGILYFMGGWNGTLSSSPVDQRQMKRVDTYTVATDTWGTVADMPATRHGHNVDYFADGIYVFGGLTNGGSTVNNDVIRYSIGDRTWNQFIAPWQQPPIRCYSSFIQYKGKFYVFGGYKDGNGLSAYNDFWEYTPLAQTWKQIPLTGYAIPDRGGHIGTVSEGEFHFMHGRGGNPMKYLTDHFFID